VRRRLVGSDVLVSALGVGPETPQDRDLFAPARTANAPWSTVPPRSSGAAIALQKPAQPPLETIRSPRQGSTGSALVSGSLPRPLVEAPFMVVGHEPTGSRAASVPRRRRLSRYTAQTSPVSRALSRPVSAREKWPVVQLASHGQGAATALHPAVTGSHCPPG
jgi:hypothetical protein